MIAAAAPDTSPKVDPMDHQGLVRSIARRYVGRGLEYEDLVSEGQIGLLRACERFEPQRETKFATYATYWIKQAIGRGVRNKGSLIRVPSHLHDETNAIRNGKVTIEDLTPAQCKRVERAGLLLGARPRNEADGSATPHLSLANVVADPRELSPPERCEAAETRAAIDAALAKIHRRYRTVLEMRHGLTGDAFMTLEEVGAAMGITKERVRQLETRAIEQIKGYLTMTNGTIHASGSLSRLDLLPAVTLGPLDDGPATTSRACPKCGKPYGKKIRCYACSPGLPNVAKAAGHSAPPRITPKPLPTPGELSRAVAESPTPARLPVPPPTPTVAPAFVVHRPIPSPPPPSVLLAEIEAMRLIAVALDGLDEGAQGRVLGWFVDRRVTREGGRAC